MNGLPRKCVAELIGTFMLCFIGAGSIITNQLYDGIGLLAIAVAHGLALSIAVSATMNISGGHVNPAVSVIMLITGRLRPVEAGGYIASQLAGGVIAGLALKIIFSGIEGGAEAMSVTGLGTPAPGAGVSVASALIMEIFLTFLLIFAIFGTAVDSRAPAIGGFGIGLTIAADILIGGPVSGASMNPARTFGPGLIGGVWDAHWIYWVGPIAGAVIAGLIYQFLLLGDQE
jgi:MIP family channel proteins